MTFAEAARCGRNNNFNLIRMIAAAGVLVSHAYPITLGPGAEQPLQSLLHGKTLGGVCVAVFFAVSGYFIAHSFLRTGRLRAFVRARVLRIFPALAVVLAITVVVSGLFLSSAAPNVFWPDAGAYFLRNFTLFSLQYPLADVFADNPYGPAINGSLWTLRHEVMCYAAVAIAGMLGVLRGGPVFILGLLGVCVAYAASLTLELPGVATQFFQLAFPFALGTLFRVWGDRLPLNWFVAAILTAAAIAAHPFPLAFKPLFLIALSYGVFCLGFLIRGPILAYNRLGDYSYGLYIYAFPVQQLAVLWGATTPWLNVAFAAPLSLVLAALSWSWIEKPALALKSFQIK